MSDSPTGIIDAIISGKRPEKALTTFPGGFAGGWHMEIPDAFADSLDMTMTEKTIDGEKKAVWSQGTNFRFKEGDLLYDNPRSYQPLWKEALAHVGLCVQVERATPVAAGSPRFPGLVEFKVFRPDAAKTKLVFDHSVQATQDSFVRFLITGTI